MTTRILLLIVFVITAFDFSLHASDFKLNKANLEQLFSNSKDITNVIHSQDSTSTVDSIPEYKDPALVNKKKAAWLAILGSPLGLHSFYMGHNKAGRQHLYCNLISIGAITGIAILAGKNYDITEPPLSCVTLLVTVMMVYVGVDKLLGLIEGLSYYSMSDEKFRNNVVKKPNYFH
jgi:hypothetical protein